jgi:hypothetical protein
LTILADSGETAFILGSIDEMKAGDDQVQLLGLAQ